MKTTKVLLIISLYPILCFSCLSNNRESQLEIYNDVVEDLFDVSHYFGAAPSPSGTIDLGMPAKEIDIVIMKMNIEVFHPSTLSFIGIQNKEVFLEKFNTNLGFGSMQMDSVYKWEENDHIVTMQYSTDLQQPEAGYGVLRLSDVRLNEAGSEGVFEFQLSFYKRKGERSIVFVRFNNDQWEIVEKHVIVDI